MTKRTATKSVAKKPVTKKTSAKAQRRSVTAKMAPKLPAAVKKKLVADLPDSVVDDSIDRVERHLLPAQARREGVPRMSSGIRCHGANGLGVKKPAFTRLSMWRFSITPAKIRTFTGIWYILPQIQTTFRTLAD